MTEFEDIYKTYFKDVYLFLFGLAKDEQLAQEITEEAFFHALKKIHSFRGDCDIRVWLCQIAKNEYYQHLRKTKHLVLLDEEGTSEDIANNSSRLETSSTFEQKLLDTETSLRVHRILHNLPDPYKEVFSLRIFGELSFEQIGTIFGKTANWACVTYHRAKLKIQDEMEEFHG